MQSWRVFCEGKTVAAYDIILIFTQGHWRSSLLRQHCTFECTLLEGSSKAYPGPALRKLQRQAKAFSGLLTSAAPLLLPESLSLLQSPLAHPHNLHKGSHVLKALWRVRRGQYLKQECPQLTYNPCKRRQQSPFLTLWNSPSRVLSCLTAKSLLILTFIKAPNQRPL